MNEGQAYDEQGLPWLEAVDDEDGPRGVSATKMLAALLFVLLAVGIVAATLFWIRASRRRVGNGGARADPGRALVRTRSSLKILAGSTSPVTAARRSPPARARTRMPRSILARRPKNRLRGPRRNHRLRRKLCQGMKPRNRWRPRPPRHTRARAERAAQSSSVSTTIPRRPRRRGPRYRRASRRSGR